ncbi:MAG: hypothetical protein FWG50_12775 [Kiritimatiellaeota bacterium]|nr:hypothetical protein [Kiritimatiellota bacterium]
MKRLLDRVLRNAIVFEVIAVFLYAFYCLVFAVAATPAALLLRWGARQFLGGGFFMLFVFVFLCFAAFYIFLVSSTLFVGAVERVMTLGMRPGAYPTGSPAFTRWLAYSGLHLWMVLLVLPCLRGGNWIKMYLRITGAKIGRGAFLNTKDFYDPYLLEIGDNVVIGGDATLTCHLFEGGRLHLGRISLGDGTAIGAHAYLTPGTTTGKNSKVGMNTFLQRNTAVRNGETHLALPGMTLRQAVKLMRKEKD